MLLANRKLGFVKLSVSSYLIRLELKHFIAQTLPVVKTPLPLDRRLAFLSVVEFLKQRSPKEAIEAEQLAKRRQRLEGLITSIPRNDQEDVARSFLFAAEPKACVVQLEHGQ